VYYSCPSVIHDVTAKIEDGKYIATLDVPNKV